MALRRAYDQADTLLAQAEALRRVRGPIRAALRGWLDYWRSRRLVDDPPAADRSIARGSEHAERALRLDRADADALELRGDLRYWRWLLGVEARPGPRAAAPRPTRARTWRPR